MSLQKTFKEKDKNILNYILNQNTKKEIDKNCIDNILQWSNNTTPEYTFKIYITEENKKQQQKTQQKEIDKKYKEEKQMYSCTESATGN